MLQASSQDPHFLTCIVYVLLSLMIIAMTCPLLYQRNVGISYLIVITKFGFFKISIHPLLFHKKLNLSNFDNIGDP